MRVKPTLAMTRFRRHLFLNPLASLMGLGFFGPEHLRKNSKGLLLHMEVATCKVKAFSGGTLKMYLSNRQPTITFLKAMELNWIQTRCDFQLYFANWKANNLFGNNKKSWSQEGELNRDKIGIGGFQCFQPGFRRNLSVCLRQLDVIFAFSLKDRPTSFTPDPLQRHLLDSLTWNFVLFARLKFPT